MKHVLKYSLATILVLVINCGILYFLTDGGLDLAFAQDTSSWSSLDETMFDLTNIFQWVLKLIYIILRPLLVVAGNALDNTFVYGEFLNLDAALRQMWNISKNFANFALWFWILFYIFKYIFAFGDGTEVKDVLWKSLLAGVWIQMSWFLLGAIIDISTIATYALGWLPMTLINQTQLGNHPIIWIHTVVDLWNDKSKISDKISYSMYYSWWDTNYAPCIMVNDFIVGRQFDDVASKKKNIVFDPDWCVYNNFMMVNIKDITESTKSIKSDEWISNQKVKNDTVTSAVNWFFNGKDENAAFLKWVVYTKYLADPWARSIQVAVEWETTPKAIKIPNDVKLLQEMEWSTEKYERVEEFQKRCEWNVNKWWCGMFLKDLLEKSEWFVWPLVTLYVSMLNFTDLHVSTVGWGWWKTSYATFFEFALKAATWIMMIIPLITLAIVLVIRVGILWVIIATSPLLIIWLVFYEEGLNSLPLWGMKLDVKSIIWLIFAPVLLVFALSISLLFLYTLQDSIYDQEHSQVREGLGLTIAPWATATEECMNARGLFDVCYEVGLKHPWGWVYADMFARLIMNGFGLWLVWTLVFAAINATSMTKWIAESVTKTMTWIATAIPIGWVSVSSIWSFKDAIENSAKKKFIDKPNSESRAATQSIVDWIFNPDDGWSEKVSNAIDKINKNSASIWDIQWFDDTNAKDRESIVKTWTDKKWSELKSEAVGRLTQEYVQKIEKLAESENKADKKKALDLLNADIFQETKDTLIDKLKKDTYFDSLVKDKANKYVLEKEEENEEEGGDKNWKDKKWKDQKKEETGNKNGTSEKVPTDWDAASDNTNANATNQSSSDQS